MPPDKHVVFEEGDLPATARVQRKEIADLTTFLVRQKIAKDAAEARSILLILSAIAIAFALLLPIALVLKSPRLSADIIQHAHPILKAK